MQALWTDGKPESPNIVFGSGNAVSNGGSDLQIPCSDIGVAMVTRQNKYRYKIVKPTAEFRALCRYGDKTSCGKNERVSIFQDLINASGFNQIRNWYG